MSAARRANKSKVFVQDKNTNGNEENNNNLSQISKSTLVRSKRVATVDWDTRNSARLLQKTLVLKKTTGLSK